MNAISTSDLMNSLGAQAKAASALMAKAGAATKIKALRELARLLRENRVWGVKEKLMERALPLIPPAQLAQWLQDAHTVDGIVKGLKQPDWPADPWDALHRMAVKVAQALEGQRAPLRG